MEGRHEVGGGSGGSLAMGGLCSAPGPELRFNVANSRGVWSWLSGPARVPFHSVHVSYLASRNLRG